MRIKQFFLAIGLALGVVGCEKVSTAVAKFARQKASMSSPVAQDSTSAPKAGYRRDQISEISPESYPGFIARKNALVLVDFHAEWCGPCKMADPVLAKAAEDHPGVVYVGKMNVDHAGAFPGSLGVGGLPDLRIYKDGKEVDRIVGFPGDQVLLEKIAYHARGIQQLPAVETLVKAPVQSQAEPAIKPFSKGWLPPGMSRPSQAKTTPKP